MKAEAVETGRLGARLSWHDSGSLQVTGSTDLYGDEVGCSNPNNSYGIGKLGGDAHPRRRWMPGPVVRRDSWIRKAGGV